MAGRRCDQTGKNHFQKGVDHFDPLIINMLDGSVDWKIGITETGYLDGVASRGKLTFISY
jgi:hypothetical protein